MATSQQPSMQPQQSSTGSDQSEGIVEASQSPVKNPTKAMRVPHESKRLASEAPPPEEAEPEQPQENIERGQPEVNPELQQAAEEDAERALEDNEVDHQGGELIEQQEFQVSRQEICDQVIPYYESKSEGSYKVKMGNQAVIKVNADKENLNPSGETKLEVWVGGWEQKTPQFMGIIVTNRNACRSFAAGECTRHKCNFYHANPGDLVDNLVFGGYQVLEERPPSDLLLDRKAKHYFWSDRDKATIDDLEKKILKEYAKRFKAMRRARRPKTVTLEEKLDEMRRKFESEDANGEPLVEEVDDEDESQDEEPEGVLPVKPEPVAKRVRKAADGKRLHKDKKRKMFPRK